MENTQVKTAILDTIIHLNQEDRVRHFTPSEFLNTIFNLLSEKERDVLTRRFGLYGTPSQTLEFIGKHYGITRERVRQIAVGAIKKMRGDKQFLAMRDQVESVLEHILRKYGGAMEEVMLIDTLLAETDMLPSTKKEREAEYVNMKFILQQLMPDQFALVTGHLYRRGWRLLEHPEEVVQNAVEDLHTVVQEEGKPQAFEDIFTQYEAAPSYKKMYEFVTQMPLASEEHVEQEIMRIVHTLMYLSSKLASNILDEWGLAAWPTVRPKKINDKIYLVLRKEGKPLHFNDITERINSTNFDEKKAYVGTVHNELILDKKYVLVGRGMYALRDWGYTGGTVAQIVDKVLSASGEGLTRKEIIEQVLEQKHVKESTIYLALSDKDRFAKNEQGRYIKIV